MEVENFNIGKFQVNLTGKKFFHKEKQVGFDLTREREEVGLSE